MFYLKFLNLESFECCRGIQCVRGKEGGGRGKKHKDKGKSENNNNLRCVTQSGGAERVKTNLTS